MDPLSLTMIAIGFAASKVVHKVADETMDSVWAWARERLKTHLKAEPTPASLTAEVVQSAIGADRDILERSSSVFSHSSALRRAILQEDLLSGARVLWVDDHPENNSWERQAFEIFGTRFVMVETHAAAVRVAEQESFDAVISDIERDSGPSGIETLAALRLSGPATPFIFYVGALTPGLPPGAFGITNDPEELLHLLLDALGRRRV